MARATTNGFTTLQLLVYTTTMLAYRLRDAGEDPLENDTLMTAIEHCRANGEQECWDLHGAQAPRLVFTE